MNTYFSKPPEKKWTWESPSGHKNEINYFLLKAQRDVSNMEVLNCFDFISDHRLIRINMKIKKARTILSKTNITSKRKTILNESQTCAHLLRQNLEKSSDFLQNTCILGISLHLHLQMFNTHNYDVLIKIITKTATELKNPKRTKHKVITEDTQKLIKKRTLLEKIKHMKKK